MICNSRLKLMVGGDHGLLKTGLDNCIQFHNVEAGLFVLFSVLGWWQLLLKAVNITISVLSQNWIFWTPATPLIFVRLSSKYCTRYL